MIGHKIKTLFKLLKIEPKEVANKAGVTPCTVYNFLNEKHDAKISVLIKLLKGAGLSVHLVIEKDNKTHKIDL